MRKRVMVVGIMSFEMQKARTIAIAKGEYKPKKGEPKIWFNSMASMSQVLSDDNQRLLKTIANENPGSLKTLGEMTGRASSNLSRTLKTLERYGMVKLHKEEQRVIPEAVATSFDIKTGDWGFMQFMQTKQSHTNYYS